LIQPAILGFTWRLVFKSDKEAKKIHQGLMWLDLLKGKNYSTQCLISAAPWSWMECQLNLQSFAQMKPIGGVEFSDLPKTSFCPIVADLLFYHVFLPRKIDR